MQFDYSRLVRNGRICQNSSNSLMRWCNEAGSDITIKYLSKCPLVISTPADDSNPFWVALTNTFEELLVLEMIRESIICREARTFRFHFIMH